MVKVALKNEIRQIIYGNLNKKYSCNVNYDTDLIENKIIDTDSFRILIQKFEEKYKCRFEENEIDMSKFCNINTIEMIINQKINIKSYTIKRLFHEICQRNNEKIAIDFDDVFIKYSELEKNVNTISDNLQGLGIRRGSRVAIILPNCLEYVYTYFALFNIGAWPVPISVRWEKSEVKNVLMNAEIDAIVYKKQIGVIKYNEVISEIEKELKSLKRVIFVREDIELLENIVIYNEIDFKTLLDENECSYEEEIILPDDIAMLSYTSGTTGEPKGVAMINNSIIATSIYSSYIIGGEGNTPFSIAPLYSAQGFLSLLMCFVDEGTMSLISTFNPNAILKKISQRKNNIMHTQPTMWALLLACNAIKFAKFDALNILIVSGSCCSPVLANRIEETLKCKLLNVYGLIEATSSVTITYPSDDETIRFNTVGRPIPGTEIKIVDSERKIAAKGEVGELAVRGYLMKEYYKNPEKTREIMDEEGWMYTGDLARYYDDVNICIVGRCKDMIIRGGFNVYPSDVEAMLMGHEKVMDVAVVAREHKIVGEQIVAFVIPKPGVYLTKNELIGYSKGKIANYKIPDDVIFINQMPIILSGKVDKKILKDWAKSGVDEENVMHC